MAAIINSGRNKIALQQGNSQPLNITKFVFANVPDLNPSAAVDLNQSLPAAEHIVYEKNKDAQGYVAPDQVVYSVILSPAVGDFYFNWIGLVDADNTLISVSYSPLQYKYKTVGLAVGNTLTRNFLIQFSDAKETTGINVPVEAWQIDFMSRLNDADEHLRQDMSDFFGSNYFIGQGFQIVAAGAVVSAKAGVGFISGLRVALNADQVIDVGVLPKDIWLDVHLSQGASHSDVVFQFRTTAVGALLSDYTDSANTTHYVEKIASVSSGFAVTDYRRVITVNNGILDELITRINAKANSSHAHLENDLPTATTAAKGIVRLSNATSSNSETDAATPKAVKVAHDLAAGKQNNLGFTPVQQGTGQNQQGNTLSLGWSDSLNLLLSVDGQSNGAFLLKQPAALNDWNMVPELTGGTVSVSIGALNRPAAIPEGHYEIFFSNYNAGIGLIVGANGDSIYSFRKLSNNWTISKYSTEQFSKNASNLLEGTLSHSIFPFSYGVGVSPGYVVQRDLGGNIFVPTAPAGTADTRAANTAYVMAAVAALVNSSPGALDTLGELAAALGNDPNFATTILNAIAGKQNNLGFTPVQQGTGQNQQGNTLSLGWSDSLNLLLSVDAQDIGAFLIKRPALNDWNLIPENSAGSVSVSVGAINRPIGVPDGYYEVFFSTFSSGVGLIVAATGSSIFGYRKTSNIWDITKYSTEQSAKNASNLSEGILNHSIFPFSYGVGVSPGYVVQRDLSGNIFVPTAPAGTADTRAANTAYVSEAILSSKIQTLIWSGSSTAFDMDTLPGGHPGTGFYLVTVSGYTPCLIYLTVNNHAFAVAYASTPDATGINVVTISVDSSNTIRALKSTTSGMSPYLALSEIYKIG